MEPKASLASKWKAGRPTLGKANLALPRESIKVPEDTVPNPWS